MKVIITSLVIGISFFSSLNTYAACKDGTRSNSRGLSLQSDGCYSDGSGHEYLVTYSSSSSSLSSMWPDTTDQSTIFDGAVSNNNLRTWNLSMNDIPKAIVSVITFLLGIAGTISVLALIYHAVKMQLASGITGDSSGVDKAKSGMKGALIGFMISILAWFLVRRFVEILSSIS